MRLTQPPLQRPALVHRKRLTMCAVALFTAGSKTVMIETAAAGRSLHFQVSFAETELTKIITIYEPDPNEWIDYRTRS